MSANYKLVRTPSPKKSGEERPLHVCYVPNKTVSLKDMEKMLLSTSSFSMADVKGVLHLLQTAIVDNLMMGNDVCLDGIGTFTMSLQCRPVMDKKEIRSESIHFKNVKFRSAKELRKRLWGTPLFRAPEEEKEEFSTEDCRKRLLWYFDNKQPFITGRAYQALNHCGKTKAAAQLKQFSKEGTLTRQGYGPTTFYTKGEGLALK